MDTSVKLNDFVTMQGQVSAAKVNGSDYKNEAFYGFMQQTAQTQKTSSDNTATKSKPKKDTASKDTAKEDSVNTKEDVTKPDKQQGEETNSKDVEEVKDNMMQQVDLAVFAAVVNTNIVPVENQAENAVVETPIVQTDAVQATTQMNVDVTQQTAVEGNVVQQGNENGAEQVVQQTTVQTEETVAKETPKEVEVEKAVEVQPKQEQKQQTEAIKADVKTETAKATEETVVVKTEQTITETKTDTAQTNTSEEETNFFEEEIPTTNTRTFSDDVINIKVGENAQISSGEMAQKVSDKMLAKFAQHENEFEIQLMPKELGKIVIKLVRSEEHTSELQSH